MRRGKKYKQVLQNKPQGAVSVEEALEILPKLSTSQFEGSVELHVKLRVPKTTDPKSIKGSFSLPHAGETRTVKIAVFTSKDKENEAKEAGADFYEFDKLVQDVKDGKVEFDVAIATPDVMPKIAPLGKTLGPKGLMPNPKLGTVTDDLATAIQEFRKGKSNFKADVSGAVHVKVGKLTQDKKELLENIREALSAIASAIGKTPEQAITKAHLAPTMGPAIEVNIKSA